MSRLKRLRYSSFGSLPLRIKIDSALSRENVIWGAPRIRSELLKLGIKISEASVAKYMVRHHKPPSRRENTQLRRCAEQRLNELGDPGPWRSLRRARTGGARVRLQFPRRRKTQNINFNPSCITRLLPEPMIGLPAATSGVAPPPPYVWGLLMSLPKNEVFDEPYGLAMMG